MSVPAHLPEDTLLGLAYGELPLSEARAAEAHLQGCASCQQAAAALREVRQTMQRLPLEAAPEGSLDSVLHYAQQAADRARAPPRPKRVSWAWASLAAGVLAVGGLVLNRAGRGPPPPTEGQASAPALPPGLWAKNESRVQPPHPTAAASLPEDARDVKTQRVHKAAPVAQGREEGSAPVPPPQAQSEETSQADVAGAKRTLPAEASGAPEDSPSGAVARGDTLPPSKPSSRAASPVREPAERSRKKGLAPAAASAAGANLETAEATPAAAGAPPSSGQAEDLPEEAARLRKKLVEGAHGAERVRLLKRLCEVETELKRPDAQETCALWMKEASAGQNLPRPHPQHQAVDPLPDVAPRP